MNISQSRIRELQAILLNHFGEAVNKKEAEIIGTELVALVEAIGR